MKRKALKTREQLTRYFEVRDFFDYLHSVYLNGNIEIFKMLIKSMKVRDRKNFAKWIALEYKDCELSMLIIAIDNI